MFPLYDSLCEDVKAEKTKGVDMRSICMTINTLRQNINNDVLAKEHFEIIAALIVHHESLESRVKFTSNPYQAKTTGTGPVILMTQLPPQLQHIIAAYILRVAEK